MALELDHVFCFVEPGGGWAEAATARGWVLDEGIEHEGQGTRNRRLCLPDQFVEFLWLCSRADAERNPLRLDRRADWRTTGACPFGIGLRGQVTAKERAEFWTYEPPYAPGGRILIHRANETAPDRPFVFVMEAPPEAIDRFRPRNRLAGKPELLAHARPAGVREVRLGLPAAAQAVLGRVVPPVTFRPAPTPSMAVVVGDGDEELALTDELSLVG